MTDLSIDRLVLDIPGLDAAGGRWLAQSIGEAFAAMPPSEGGSLYNSHKTLRVSLDDVEGIPLDQLAIRIAAALRMQIS